MIKSEGQHYEINSRLEDVKRKWKKVLCHLTKLGMDKKKRGFEAEISDRKNRVIKIKMAKDLINIFSNIYKECQDNPELKFNIIGLPYVEISDDNILISDEEGISALSKLSKLFKKKVKERLDERKSDFLQKRKEILPALLEILHSLDKKYTAITNLYLNSRIDRNVYTLHMEVNKKIGGGEKATYSKEFHFSTKSKEEILQKARNFVGVIENLNLNNSCGSS